MAIVKILVWFDHEMQARSAHTLVIHDVDTLTKRFRT